MLNKEDIAVVYLTQNNVNTYRDRLSAFECNNPQIDRVIRSAPIINTTNILFVNTKTSDVTGFCAFCCACLKKSDEVFPAVEIKTFAVNADYQDLFLDDGVLCAAYLLNYCVSMIKELTAERLYAKYILLESVEKDEIKRFYEKNNFTKFSADYTFFGITLGGGREKFFFINID